MGVTSPGPSPLYVHVTHLTPLASHLTPRHPQLSGAGVHWLAKAVKEGAVGFEAIIIDEAGQVRCGAVMVTVEFSVLIKKNYHTNVGNILYFSSHQLSHISPPSFN